MPLPNSIDAPYNFVPLADWVYLPDWATRVSHDLPFRDGLCGHLDLTLTAHTPILVGREQVPATDNAPGEVHPYQLPDGRYALPGTALKGMIRNAVEILTFSRMSAVDDRRHGVRDLTGGLPAYQRAMTISVDGAFKPLTKSGWLFFDVKSSQWMIQNCNHARVEHKLLLDYLGRRAKWVSITNKESPTARQKYESWEEKRSLNISFDAGSEQAHKHSKDKKGKDKYLIYRKATNLGQGSESGTLVFTGQPSPKKHMEFIFFGERGRPSLVPESVFRGFLDIHDEMRAANSSTAWSYWKGQPRIPVFYLEEPKGEIGSFGLAMMYKIPYKHSIRDAISQTCQEHCKDEGEDFATLLFGRVGENPASCLKGRVSFNHAISKDAQEPLRLEPTILNGPKSTYYPNYIQQPHAQNNLIPNRHGYKTLMDDECRIRGWKRYPARPEERVGPQPLTSLQPENPEVQTILKPLHSGTRFSTRLVFHNLRPEELGAICWALTWGGDSELRHSLGMGKPFGFGQLSIMIDNAEIRPNAAHASTPTWQQCSDIFVKHMDAAHQDHHKDHRKWRDALEIKTLLAMADPRIRPAGNSQLCHMSLTTEDQNDFKDAKKAGLVLADYPRRDIPSTWAERDAEQKRLQLEAETAAKIAAMSDEEKDIMELRGKLEEARRFNRNKAGDPLAQEFREISKKAKNWPPEARAQLVELLREINKFLEGNKGKRKELIDALL